MAIKNPKAKGSRNERRAIDMLEFDGWYCTNSKGSFGVFDIWAMSPVHAHLRMIQVKTNRMPPPQERHIIATDPLPSFCQREIWIFKDGKPRKPRVLVWRNNKWVEAENFLEP